MRGKAYIVITGRLNFNMDLLSPSAREEIQHRVMLERMGWEFVDWRSVS